MVHVAPEDEAGLMHVPNRNQDGNTRLPGGCLFLMNAGWDAVFLEAVLTAHDLSHILHPSDGVVVLRLVLRS